MRCPISHSISSIILKRNPIDNSDIIPEWKTDLLFVSRPTNRNLQTNNVNRIYWHYCVSLLPVLVFPALKCVASQSDSQKMLRLNTSIFISTMFSLLPDLGVKALILVQEKPI